jgi:putative PIN family toxin of toxin-antitoxin system
LRTLDIVLDTNIVVSAMKSKRGASYAILEKIYSDEIVIHLSIPLVMEYEEVLSRTGFVFPQALVSGLIDDLCSVGIHHEVYFLWRPYLKDPDDDFVLELALRSGCDYLVTHNVRDFAGIDKLGITVIRPKDLLARIRDMSNE